MPLTKDNIQPRVEEALESIRPYLRKDGGDVEFAGFDEERGIVFIRWLGNCTQCGMSPMTQAGIEDAIRSHIPEVSGVQAMSE